MGSTGFAPSRGTAAHQGPIPSGLSRQKVILRHRLARLNLDNSDPRQELQRVIEDVTSNLDADLILYAGGIDPPSHSDIHSLIRSRCRRRPNVLLFLTTDGGSADVAYQIARCLQRAYKDGKFILFVNTSCKSAGTLIATGADELIMSDEAELGPLDVQVYKRDELGERISGLTPIQALTTLRREAFRSFEQYLVKIRVSSRFQITTMSSAEIAAKLTNGCFGPIYQQIDPMGLGEHQRAMMIASAYGIRLDKNNLKPNALERLIAGYPSHEYVIDREEAGELFHSVNEPSPAQLQMALMLGAEVDEAVHRSIHGEPAILRFLSGEIPEDLYNAGGGVDGQEHANTGQVSPPPGTNGGEAIGHNGSGVADGRDSSPAPDPVAGSQVTEATADPKEAP
jgi:hypothetical protein